MSNAETYVLGLTNRTANAIITNIAQEQARNAGQPLKHRFTLRLPVGNATTELSLIKDPDMTIGIYGLFSLSDQVSDQQFIKTGIAMEAAEKEANETETRNTNLPDDFFRED